LKDWRERRKKLVVREGNSRERERLIASDRVLRSGSEEVFGRANYERGFFLFRRRRRRELLRGEWPVATTRG
jgi:hypothetical protein